MSCGPGFTSWFQHTIFLSKLLCELVSTLKSIKEREPTLSFEVVSADVWDNTRKSPAWKGIAKSAPASN